MNLTVVMPPPFEPVTLAQVYAQLRLTPDHIDSPSEVSHPDDAMLSAHVKAAREFVEVSTRRALIQQTLRVSDGCFPVSPTGWLTWTGAWTRVRLLRPPLIRVESVAFYDGDNALTTLDPAEYFVTDEQVPELQFGSAFSAPTTYARSDAVRVDYVVGYAPSGSPATTQEEYAANVPETLKQCVLLGVQLLYDNLSSADREGIEKMREAMLQTYRIQHAP